MRLPDTPEMAELWKGIEPYFDEHLELKEDTPEQVKKDLEKYRRLGKEQFDFAYSLM